jgi:hypothetical protein
MNRIVETFNRVTPGSISEMMPDYGCFTIAWTSYGIVVPLIGHVFGIRPDAVKKTVVFEPHPPEGWGDMSIEDLPVGTNLISFSRTETGKGVEYTWPLKMSATSQRIALWAARNRPARRPARQVTQAMGSR